MCVLFLAYKVRKDLPFFIAENRDEYHNRDFTPLHLWKNPPHLWAGKDIPSAGTWMGITTKGRFAAVTNFRSGYHRKTGALSRGQIVLSFLAGENSPENFCSALKPDLAKYNGFNLIFGTLDDLYFLSSREGVLHRFDPGFYGLSNADLGTPWPKVKRGLEKFKTFFEGESLDERAIAESSLDLLSDKSLATIEELPSTGVPKEVEHKLSAIFVVLDGYSTVVSSAISLNSKGEIYFREKCFGPLRGGSDQEVTFHLEK